MLLARVPRPPVPFLVARPAATVSEDLVAPAGEAARERLRGVVRDLQVRHQLTAMSELLTAVLTNEVARACAGAGVRPARSRVRWRWRKLLGLRRGRWRRARGGVCQNRIPVGRLAALRVRRGGLRRVAR